MKPTLLLGLLAAGWACAGEQPVQPMEPSRPILQATQAAAGYQMIDLGTLGGTRAFPNALNDAGQVVGWYSGADYTRHAFLWQSGSMQDLFPENGSSDAQVITQDGVILGERDRFGGPGGSTCVAAYLFMSKDGVTTDLNGASSCGGLRVIGMTESGSIVETVVGEQNSRAYIWEGGVQQNLGSLKPLWGYATATAVNNKGQIVGYSPVENQAGFYINHPFIWEDGAMRDLGILAEFPCDENPAKNCGNGQALAINSKGDVVGGSNNHAVMWTGAGIVDLGAGSPLDGAAALAINEPGEVVGYIGMNAFDWRKGALSVLPSLGGPSKAVALNEAGVIAGTSTSPSGEQHAVVWQGGQIVDLGVGEAVAINGNGDVIGTSGGHAILWRRAPADEVAQQ